MAVALRRAQAVAFRDAFSGPIDSLVGIYRDAAARALEILSNPLATSAQWTRARALLVQYHAVLSELDDEAGAWITANLPTSYQAGAQYADAELAKLRKAGLNFPLRKPEIMSLVNREAVARLVGEMQRTLGVAHAALGRRVDDLFRRVGLEVSGQAVAGGWARVQASKEIRERLIREGRLTFVDRLGREWDLDRYAEMVARTTMAQANIEGTVDRLLAHGIHLAQVSAYRAEDFCRYYEGMVVNIGPEPHPDYPDRSAIEGGPIFHPQCGHRLRPFVERFKTQEQREAGKPNMEKLWNDKEGRWATRAELQRQFRKDFPKDYKAERERLKEQARKSRERLQRLASKKISDLKPREVAQVAFLPASVAARFGTTSRAVVLTGGRRSHYLREHPEMARVEHLLPKLLTQPTAVLPNRTNEQVAIFYLQTDTQYLRGVVWMAPPEEAGEKFHSVVTLRYARAGEFEQHMRRGGW